MKAKNGLCRNIANKIITVLMFFLFSVTALFANNFELTIHLEGSETLSFKDAIYSCLINNERIHYNNLANDLNLFF